MMRKKVPGSDGQATSLLIGLGESPSGPFTDLGAVPNGPPGDTFEEGEEEDPIYVYSNDSYGCAGGSPGTYFRDGKTKIDFVLVWEEKLRPAKKRRSKEPRWGGERAGGQGARWEVARGRHERWKQKFLRNLQSAGLLMEKEETLSERKGIHYLKLSAPWEVLVYYAEELCLRAPLQAHPNPDRNSSDDLLRKLRLPNVMAQQVPKKPVDYYTCAFRKSKLGKFLGSDLHDSYFTNTQRHRIVYEILARTIYGKRKHAEIGIDRLLNEGIYAAAFPLHEGPFELPDYEVLSEELNPRQILYRFWAQWRCWYKYQPLDHIREYFGEKVAIYFAWLGFYTAWLLPAAAVGTLVFLAGLFTMGTNTPAQETCSSGGQFLMCPLCDTCGNWNLSEICPMAKVGYLFDHPGTVFFSIFMSFWAVTFLEYWKRKNATLAHHWNCMDFQEEEASRRWIWARLASPNPSVCWGRAWPAFPVAGKGRGSPAVPATRWRQSTTNRHAVHPPQQPHALGVLVPRQGFAHCTHTLLPAWTWARGAGLWQSICLACRTSQVLQEHPRPEFAAMAPCMEQNPITGVKEPHLPARDRLSRIVTGSMAVIVMLCVVMIFLVSVIMYRGIVSTMMYHTGNAVLVTQAGNIANISSSMVNLVLILLLSQVYTSLAEKLTRWEMHRTQTQHEDAFTFKVFIFQFVNFYSSPFYVAFFKGRFVGYPGQYGKLLGMRNEDCGPGGCLIELAQQLFIIMVGKQIVSNIQEFLIPKLKSWRQKRKLARVRGAQICQEPKPWEEDYELIECEGLFEEYLEMVLQFGFITIFVAAFPLAPLFALLNNWVDIRLDAQKFVCEYRRPVAERAQDISVWLLILDVLAQISVIVNAFLIAFTSDFLPRLLYQYEYDSHLHGYVNFTLAYAPPSYVNSNHTMCRYKAFRDAHGSQTLFYWKLLAIRLGFIIAFEHVVFFCLHLIGWLVPDVPESLEVKIKRERYLAKQALADNQDVLLTQAAFYPTV
ncbi:anoctamin-7-like isoform X2 [Rhineura floridana]|uniref:anoctamin-7-like isoform X2 n=1 Tax=Rhineura floridana TaxID=261503 RepID=UPI002AC84D6D|nr:anoctamin-7-like isoform X2 [Rhineura floridana]